MKKVLIGGILGGIVFMIWQSFSWMTLPWHIPQSIPEAEPLIEMLRQRNMEHGVYVYPGLPDEKIKNLPTEEQERIWGEVEAQFARGPRIAKLVYLPEGGPMRNPSQFVKGLLVNILMALLAAYLLFQASDRMKGFGDRFKFVLLIGLVAALAGPLTDWNWWNYPTGFILPVALDRIIGWFLVAVVLAVLMKRPILEPDLNPVPKS